MRKLHIKDAVYKYAISEHFVKVRGLPKDKGQTVVFAIKDFFNVTFDEIDRAKWKGSGYQVKPSMIKDRLTRYLGGDKSLAFIGYGK